MSFKEALARDVGTFLNITENAEEVEMNGVKMRGLLSVEGGKINKVKASGQHGLKPELHGQNFIGETITLYYSTREYRGRAPSHNEFIIVNGRKYRVESIVEQLGITKLVCSAERMQTPNYPVYQ